MSVKEERADFDSRSLKVEPGGRPKGNKTYRVIIEGVNASIETPEAFSIKFSLLSRVPISKIKHLMKRLPATIWSGESEKKARQLLVLIEESGGNGKIVEKGAPAAQPAAKNAGKKPQPVVAETVCPKCGFPVRTGDQFCEFCMTHVGAQDAERDAPAPRKKVETPPQSKRTLYFIVSFAALLVVILLLKVL